MASVRGVEVEGSLCMESRVVEQRGDVSIADAFAC